MNMIWWALGIVGILLQGPMIFASVQTGRTRLFPGMSNRFEQKLINNWATFFGMFIVGTFAWIFGYALSGGVWWISLPIGLLDGYLLVTFWKTSRQELQDFLDFRMANESGEFWCRRCDEVHKIGDLHV